MTNNLLLSDWIFRQRNKKDYSLRVGVGRVAFCEIPVKSTFVAGEGWIERITDHRRREDGLFEDPQPAGTSPNHHR